MKAAIYQGIGKMEVKDIANPKVEPDAGADFYP